MLCSVFPILPEAKENCQSSKKKDITCDDDVAGSSAHLLSLMSWRKPNSSKSKSSGSDCGGEDLKVEGE